MRIQRIFLVLENNEFLNLTAMSAISYSEYFFKRFRNKHRLWRRLSPQPMFINRSSF
ncbi:hypothetical protein EMIT079MI2_40266 [Bacillus sp. IT-79MI2]